MSTLVNSHQILVLAKYCFFKKPNAVWLLPLALTLYLLSVWWRFFLGGQQDALFFQALSLGYCWYIYLASLMTTLNGLRKSSNYFFVDNIKKISFWLGLLSSIFIYACTFVFLIQIGARALIIVFMYFILFLNISNTWQKWRDVSRLSMAGIFPFLLVNGYFSINPLLTISWVWLIVFWLLAGVLLVAINISFYRIWIGKPRNFNPMDDNYTLGQSYYQKRK